MICPVRWKSAVKYHIEAAWMIKLDNFTEINLGKATQSHNSRWQMMVISITNCYIRVYFSLLYFTCPENGKIQCFIAMAQKLFVNILMCLKQYLCNFSYNAECMFCQTMTWLLLVQTLTNITVTVHVAYRIKKVRFYENLKFSNNTPAEREAVVQCL